MEATVRAKMGLATVESTNPSSWVVRLRKPWAMESGT